MRHSLRAAVPAVALVALLAGCSADSPDTPDDHPTVSVDGSHWEYSGAAGPDQWGELDHEFETCGTGTSQSPIDLPPVADTSAQEPITISSHTTTADAVDTGHTIQLKPGTESSEVAWGGAEYELGQVHFHVPSEHTLGGELAAAEFHFVHETDDGELLVLGVLATEGAASAAWQPFVDGSADPESTDLALDVGTMLPAGRDFTAYEGSLTTPPCTEGVHWIVFSSPVELSAEQIAVLDEASHGHNARPVQPLGDRSLTGGTAAIENVAPRS